MAQFKIKRILIESIVNMMPYRWSTTDGIRVIIVVNKFFTRKVWTNQFNQYFPKLLEQRINIIYCRSKWGVFKHYEASNVCFLFGLGSFLSGMPSTKQKIVYIPILGAESIKSSCIQPCISVVRPKAISANAIAEYCLSLAICLTRNFHTAIKQASFRNWRQDKILLTGFNPITDLKIGVLGLGNVGSAVASLFQRVGCTVLGCDVKPPETPSCFAESYSPADIAHFLKSSDIVIICLPLNDSTKGLIGMQELTTMKKNAILINVSRGEIVSEDALFHALKNNVIKGAVLDVFNIEPLPKFSKLYGLNNVILTPHIAGNINMFVNEITLDFIHILQASLENKDQQ